MSNVKRIYGLRETKGEIGIEIELEGRNLNVLRNIRGWRAERDGSLRGAESVELVLRNPATRRSLPQYLRRIVDASGDVVIDDTGRAGVHVHLNVQDLDITQVYNIICAYMIFEDALTEYCGADRVGNLFCLRVRDAEYLIDILRDAVVQEDFHMIADDSIRYAAINVNALARYGSLEFRAMRSTLDMDRIHTWVDMLLRIRDWAVQFRDPQDIVETFSFKGPDVVFDTVFGENPVIEFNPEAMYDGIRRAQYVAYATNDWQFDEYQRALQMMGHPKIKDWRHYGRLHTVMKNEDEFYRDKYETDMVTQAARRYLDTLSKESELEVGEPEEENRFRKARVQHVPEFAAGIMGNPEIDRDMAQIVERIHELQDEEQHGQEWVGEVEDGEDF